jgi:hypothetical protein
MGLLGGNAINEEKTGKNTLLGLFSNSVSGVRIFFLLVKKIAEAITNS